jgi:hypothetical protein
LKTRWNILQNLLNREIGDIHLIRILPERRKDPKRITDESIINWGRKYFGMNGNDEDIFFIKIVLEESEKRYPNLPPP